MLDPNQIREARYALSLSQHELARRASVSRTALNQFEQRNYQAGPSFCRKLRDYFEREGIHLEVLPDSSPKRQPIAEAYHNRLVQGAAEVHTAGLDEATGPECTERVTLGPVEILVGVGLSLILGRKIGF